jgi:hypothetical protein
VKGSPLARWFVAAAVATAAASCGGSTQRVSKSEYVTRASAVCRDANRDALAVRRDATNTATLAASIGRVLSIQRDAVRRVRAIPPPTADEQTLRQWLTLVDRSLDEAEAAQRASAQGDAAGASAANARGADLARQATAAARAYGITACVTG